MNFTSFWYVLPAGFSAGHINTCGMCGALAQSVGLFLFAFATIAMIINFINLAVAHEHTQVKWMESMAVVPMPLIKCPTSRRHLLGRRQNSTGFQFQAPKPQSSWRLATYIHLHFVAAAAGRRRMLLQLQLRERIYYVIIVVHSNCRVHLFYLPTGGAFWMPLSKLKTDINGLAWALYWLRLYMFFMQVALILYSSFSIFFLCWILQLSFHFPLTCKAEAKPSRLPS